ncbi:MAG TPA: aminotransferase class V-fold PLP-dependent enzyme [Actinomycetes bacterium]|nr:aminotransferase class V-fold PLP-dependent enzyme [Actinomycetes bacterium]
MTNSLSRRGFLARAGLATAAQAGALGLTGCTGSDTAGAGQPNPGAPAVSTAPRLDPNDWASVRDQFALDPRLAHFAAFVLASHPAPVRQAIDEYRARLDHDTAAATADERELEDAARGAAAEYLEVAGEEIALTDSTTMGLGLIYHGIALRPGDHILTSTHDFYATHEALRLAAAKREATVQRIPLYTDPAAASAAEIVSRIRAGIRPNTRLLALTWVHSSTGVKLPVRQIADAVAEVNAGRDGSDRLLFSLDAVHGLGADATGPVALGCDVFVSGTHKWLFGPRGTGIAWAHRRAWDSLAAVIPTFSGPSFGAWFAGTTAPFQFGLDGTPGGFHSFEHRWALTDAFQFHLEIGKQRVADRTSELATRLKDGLAGLPTVRLVTPRDPELSAGVVCLEVAGRQPSEVVSELRTKHQIVASVTPYQTAYVRLGPSIVTSPEQVDAAISALGSIK